MYWSYLIYSVKEDQREKDRLRKAKYDPPSRWLVYDMFANLFHGRKRAEWVVPNYYYYWLTDVVT